MLAEGGVSVQWISDIDGLLNEMIPNADGRLEINSQSLSPGEHNTSLIVRDNDLLTAQQPLLIVINAAPIPPQVQILPSNPLAGEELQVTTIGGIDPEGDPIHLTFEWYRDGVLFSDLEQPDLIPEGITQKGEAWSVRVVADDGAASAEPVYASTLVNGVAPTITDIRITGTDFYTSSLLSCEADVLDTDNDEITIDYYWQILSDSNVGELIYEGATLQLSPELLEPNDIPYCFVRTSDEDGETIESTYVTLENRAPIIDSVIVEPSTGVRPGVNLLCAASTTEPDGQNVTESHQWFRENVATGTESLISLQQELMVTTDNANKGDVLRCEVTVVDAMGLETVQSASVDVENTAPTMVDVGLIPSNPTGTDPIECTAQGSDIDGDALSYTYTWTVNGILYPTPADPAVFTEVLASGDVVTCTVQASDSIATGDSMSSSVTIVNTPPVVSAVSILETTIYTDDVVHAQAIVSDNDGDTVLVYYTWYVDGLEVKSGLGSTLKGEFFFDKEQEILVVAYAFDGIDNGLSVSSAPVMVLNSPPTDPEIDLGGEYLSHPTDLQCHITTPSTDADGDPIDYSITWTQNGAAYTGATEDVQYSGDGILSTFTSAGDLWQCTVQASDGVEVSSTVVNESTLSGCAVQNYYGIYEDLSELSAPQECWEVGRANQLDSTVVMALSTYIPSDGWDVLAFDNWDFDYWDSTDTRINATDWSYLGQGVPNSFLDTSYPAVLTTHGTLSSDQEYFLGTHCGTIYTWSCRSRYLFMESEGIAVHPSEQSIYLRWTAPLNGTCSLDLYAIGSEYVSSGAYASYAGGETSTTLYVMHNHTPLSSVDVSVYGDQYSLQESISVSGGDMIDIIVQGDQSLGLWTGLGGGLTCSFGSTQ